MGLNSKIFFALSLFTNKILTTPHYSNYTLEEEKVCSVSHRTRELSLGKDNRSAILIRDTHYFDDWSGKRRFDCRFTVKAHFEMGIFAVIQRMSLRKDTEKDACIDFIQFRPSLPIRQKMMLKLQSMFKKPYDTWDKTVCGELSPSDGPIRETEESQLALNAYIAKEGELEVRIHVADRKLEPGKSLGVEIAFTSYIDCIAPLGAYKSCGEDTCIYKEYFDDKVINCPFISCKDEPECAMNALDTELLEKGLNTKVYITAVSSIFLSFFLFLGCIMLCRYFDLLCWSDPPPVNGERATELEQVHPSAPPTDSPDKDLPPAYETLFPGR